MSILVANPMSRKNIRTIANTIREITNLNNEFYFPVVRFIEEVLVIIDKEFNYVILNDQDMPANTYAQYNASSNEMLIRESVYNGAISDIGRDRFTLAHEIGHYILHSDVVFSRVDNKNQVKTYCDPEWQADAFAGELLIPAHLINSLSIDEIAYRCKTSYQAASIQKNKNASYN